MRTFYPICLPSNYANKDLLRCMTNKIILFCLFIVVFSTCLLAAAAGYGTKTLQFVANMIAVKQCLKPVRPDWVIFESSLQNIRLQK